MPSFGLWIQIQPGDNVAATLERVAALGFGSLHVHFPHGCDEALARETAAVAQAAGLEIVAVSGYSNPLRPDDAPMGWTQTGLEGLARLLPTLGARRLVSWSGTYAPGLLDDHPNNQREVAWDELRRAVEQLLPALDAADVTLALEPWYHHVLGTAEQLARFCAAWPAGRVSTVFDPPNLLPPQTWPEQARHIEQMAATLEPHISLVHLKDMRMDGDRLELPGPGSGILDYAALRQALLANTINAPLVVEHVTLAQAGAALDFVKKSMKYE
ncbi:MAG: sugar phosphate isomerase/epimerase [Chloroflexaceae bacterium]|jgi:sugar phosphate isomerase/epimerase|nr:sugar phosphate isomerase/epimerase [Chloroflexaceae bacterium]